MKTPAAPRREQNRQATWVAIHTTAVELVLSEGLAGATADSIAAKASVSRRTFFNYFATKEDAVLGTGAPRLSDDELAAFAAATASPAPGDEFGAVVRLMTAAVRSVFDDLPSFTLEHRRLLKRHPELLARIDAHVREAEDLVRGALAQRTPALSSGADADRALVLLAGAVMRFAFAPDADGVIHDSAEAVDAAIERFRGLL